MWLLGLLTGVALTILILLQVGLVQFRRMFDNSSPDWSRPGAIWDGTLERAREVMAGVFPGAPARSYMSIEPRADPAGYHFNLLFRPSRLSDTKFIIRSVGKRAGRHRFRVELRLDARDRKYLEPAMALVRRVGPDVTRTEKRHGAIILESAVVEDWPSLMAVGEGFARDILGRERVGLCWHVAGRAAG